jgi:hypothetical protein
MKNNTVTLVCGALLSLAAPTVAAAPSHATTDAPNACIERNKGDWNACNVGNGGAGGVPYLRVSRAPTTPDECIELNQGDWNACNVGHSGAGNRPYLLVRR